MTERQEVPGILLLYHRPLYGGGAQNLWDSILSYPRHSAFPVFPVNTARAYPPALERLRFHGVFFHYTLFGLGYAYEIPPAYLEAVANSPDAPRLVSFQDEFRWCGKRFAFIDEQGIGTVYTLTPDPHGGELYRARTRARHVFSYLSSYVSHQLPGLARRFARPDEERSIDVGYRARQLPYYLGRGGQEKHEIGERFARYARELGEPLRVDVSSRELERLYGDKWWRFLGNSRATLGVESGSGVFDLEDRVVEACQALVRENPEIPFQEVHDRLLAPYEGNVPYRFIAPRNFEAAAFHVTQILYEGAYSDILQPWRHYIPLRKDFGNFDEVIKAFRDAGLRRQITAAARADLIDSHRYDFASHVAQWDRHLRSLGLEPPVGYDPTPVHRLLARAPWRARLSAHARDLHFAKFPGKGLLRKLLRSWLARR